MNVWFHLSQEPFFVQNETEMNGSTPIYSDWQNRNVGVNNHDNLTL